MADGHLSATDVADYWASDVSSDDVERVETHVFACGECARLLDGAREVVDRLRDVVRRGRFQAVVTDTVLNRLARDGTRMRTFVVEPGDIVPCAVWADDDVIVTRMRADFTGLDRVTVAMEVGGREVDRLTDVPVRPGAGELIEAFSAEQLRHLQQATVRLRVFGERPAGAETLLAEYTLEHGGNFERAES